MPDSSDDKKFYPYLLEPRRAQLHGRTYLPVEALEVTLYGKAVGWLWWNDDDLAANCEYIPFDMAPHKDLDHLRWFESIDRRVGEGMLPSAAVADIAKGGVDPAPPYRGAPGEIDPDQQPLRLPYKHLLATHGLYGSRDRPRHDDSVFKLANSYADRIPDDTPVSYAAWESNDSVMGWLWWNDELGASWHVPNVEQPESRIKDGTTLVYNHPWVMAMRDFHAEGLQPSHAIRELMKRDDGDSVVPIQQPLRARNLAHLRDITGYGAYEEARERYMASWRDEVAQRQAAESTYYELHPEEFNADNHEDPSSLSAPPTRDVSAVPKPRWKLPFGRKSKS